jgi:hypothetical protein
VSLLRETEAWIANHVRNPSCSIHAHCNLNQSLVTNDDFSIKLSLTHTIVSRNSRLLSIFPLSGIAAPSSLASLKGRS